MGEFFQYKKSLSNLFALAENFEKIPTIGKKSAFKLAYHLTFENKMLGNNIAQNIKDTKLSVCKCCNALSEDEICAICADPNRDGKELCIVSHFKDVFSIEEMGQYRGKYFVIDNNKQSLSNLQQLLEQIERFKTREIIFAFSPNIANDSLMIFIEDKLIQSGLDLKFTRIAHGVPTGIGFENIDSMSLGRAFAYRVKL
ncbi:MAG: recombination mediator RecR [Helicobacter sp.]|nr:recombination mediator RecR [Helicobacter sp.]